MFGYAINEVSYMNPLVVKFGGGGVGERETKMILIDKSISDPPSIKSVTNY